MRKRESLYELGYDTWDFSKENKEMQKFMKEIEREKKNEAKYYREFMDDTYDDELMRLKQIHSK